MILLTSILDKIQVVTGSAASVKVHASWMDSASGVITPGRTNPMAIATATTTDVVAAPAAATARNVKWLSARNDHASASTDVTIQHTDGTTSAPLWKGALAAGESVNFNEGQGWQLLDSSGAPKAAATKLDLVLRVTADVINATISFADITGLTCAVVAGKKYAFEAHLYHISNATTTGAQFGVGGVAMTEMQIAAISTVTSSATAAAMSTGQATAIDTAAVVQTTGSVTVAPTILSGYIQPSASGTFAIRGASEVAVAAGLTVKRGSWLRLRECDN